MAEEESPGTIGSMLWGADRADDTQDIPAPDRSTAAAIEEHDAKIAKCEEAIDQHSATLDRHDAKLSQHSDALAPSDRVQPMASPVSTPDFSSFM